MIYVIIMFVGRVSINNTVNTALGYTCVVVLSTPPIVLFHVYITSLYIHKNVFTYSGTSRSTRPTRTYVPGMYIMHVSVVLSYYTLLYVITFLVDSSPV